ncbi:hypothetical protein [Mesorhizobium sp. 113-3-3]|uniref:hypothetical protein n=1 Tax=Mesorhizobium sp. 113-3-3 TaxID=2744516 RepID=UPI00192826D0|nr:hypothetical protein [Mesorhizobium sp. 113-3-3]BCG79911.1 hypothetical protein MesoLj113b_34530 [Mesorhizobium sp. 113-3-3]
MFTQKTLMILGAGASKEAHLPTGDELKTRISNVLRVQDNKDFYRTKSVSNDLIMEALRHASQTATDSKVAMKLYTDAAAHISRAIPLIRSIDEFLNSHNESKETELVGKLAIVHQILDAERRSLMFEKHPTVQLDFNKLTGTWYNRMAALLFNCSLTELPTKLEALTAIVFNYDRCFEHFMLNAIKEFYRIPEGEAAKLVRLIKIYHPYGTVGSLPSMGVNSANPSPFGGDVTGGQLLELSKGIKTFTEGVDPDSSEIKAIREAVKSATTIVCLGFGFIPLNMDLLRPNMFALPTTAKKTYYATAVGLSDPDTNLIRADLIDLCPASEVETYLDNKLYCADLFREYARSLSLG